MNGEYADSEVTSSSNWRPGEPHRSWADVSDVVYHDAIFALRMAGAVPAINRLLDSEPTDIEDLIAFGRLNSYCYARWYEPMVSLLPDPRIDPETATTIAEALRRYGRLA